MIYRDSNAKFLEHTLSWKWWEASLPADVCHWSTLGSELGATFPSPNVLYPICNITGTEVYEQEHTSLTVQTMGQFFTVYLLYTEDFYF